MPADSTREQVLKNYETTASNWRANPDLIRKYYVYDGQQGIAGGVYLWKSREAADKWHGPAFRKMVKERYGAVPTSQFFETPLVVDNEQGRSS